MQIDHEFTVSVPADRAWEVLTDLAGIAPCMPGARLTGVDGDVYSGRVKIKVGPVISEYAGTARFVEKDDAAHRAVIEARGKDSRGAGNAAANIHAGLRPDGERTVVTVSTDLTISGKIAQFGSGMIKEVSAKLLGQFVQNLETKLLAPDPSPGAAGSGSEPPPPGTAAAPQAAVGAEAPAALPPTPRQSPSGVIGSESATTESSQVPKTSGSSGAGGAAGAGTGSGVEGATAGGATAGGVTAGGVTAGGAATGARHGHNATVRTTAAAAPNPAADEDDALDVMSLAGASIYKRLVPLVAALAVVVAVIVYAIAR